MLYQYSQRKMNVKTMAMTVVTNNSKDKTGNECKIENEIENDDRSDENVNGEIVNGDVICNISTVSDADNVSNDPGDVEICHRPNGNPTQVMM